MDATARIQDFILIFTSILYEALPFIVLGAIISGILEELVPQTFIAKLVPKNRLLAIAMGGFLGLVFPMCECGIIPIMRRLLTRQGRAAELLQRATCSLVPSSTWSSCSAPWLRSGAWKNRAVVAASARNSAS